MGGEKKRHTYCTVKFKCPVCDRQMEHCGEWAYTVRRGAVVHRFCCYGHMRLWQKENRTDRERAEALRLAGFAGADKTLLSKVKNPERYGVQLTAQAQKALGEGKRVRAKIRRENPGTDKTTIRVKKELKTMLQHAKNRLDKTSMNETINFIIEDWMAKNQNIQIK